MKPILIAVIMVLGTSLTAVGDFAEDFQEAKSLLKGKKHLAAHQAFTDLAARAPNQRGKAAALSYVAIAQSREGQYEEAMKLAQSIEAKPMAVYTQMTIMRDARKHKELAAAFKNEDIDTWPDEINYLGFFMRGAARNSAGDRPGAVKDIEQCVALAGSDILKKLEALDYAAGIHHVLGDDVKAMALYRKALAFYDEGSGSKGTWLYPKTLLGAVGILIKQKKYDDAHKLLAQYSEESDPKKKGYWGFLILESYGDLYAAQGKSREALDSYMDALGIKTHQGLIDRVEKKVADL